MNFEKYNIARALVCFVLFASQFFALGPALAAPILQSDDPDEQCAEGVLLFNDNKYDEALPLLEAGFSNREKGNFDDKNYLGYCALGLGSIYYQNGESDKALEAFLTALDAFKLSQNIDYENITLSHVGMTYLRLGNNYEALRYLQQELKSEQEVNDRISEGNTLNNIGIVYNALARYSEALDVMEQSLTIARELKDREGETNALNNIGSVYTNLGKCNDALEYFLQALVIEREIGDRVGEGSTLSNIGDAYNYLGEYQEALIYLQQALEIRQEYDDLLGECATLNNIGFTYQRLGQYAKALDYLEQALKIARKVNDPKVENNAIANIGQVYLEQQRYTDALEHFLMALEIQKKIGDRAGQGITLGSIGSVYHALGRFSEALEYFHQELIICQALGNHLQESSALSDIGRIYYDQGRYMEAIEYYKKSLLLAREVGSQAKESDALISISSAYAILGQTTEALSALQKALIICRENGNQRDEAVILSNLGSLQHDQGQFQEALVYYQQALTISREIGNRSIESSALNNTASIYSDQGNYTQALEFFQQSLVLNQEIDDRFGESKTLNNIGWLYDQQGQYDDALIYFQKAIDGLESLRANNGSESARTNFIEQYALMYDRAIARYYQQNQPEKAFLISERGRARAFLDSMATNYVELSDNESTELYNQEQESYSVRQSIQLALSNAKAQNPPNEKLVADLETQLNQAEKDFQAALDAISAHGNQLEQLVPGRSKVLSVSEVQSLLDDQTTILSYWVMYDQVLVFIITKDTFNTVMLPVVSHKDLNTQIQAFRAFSSTDTAYPESAVGLYHVLIEPIKSQLTRRHLMIVPHDGLHYLPFAALTDGKRYLMDDYSITYLPSVSAWQYIKQNIGGANTNLLIVGNPATDNTELKLLPFAESEAQAIAGLYQTTPLLGKMATERAVRNQAGQAGVLHLAVHGSYNSVNPLYSVLYLAPDEQNDGLLEVHEIYGLDLHKTNLVVLSACDTQLGAQSYGDELVGLTRAFFFAGTPTVVASLWSVDDASTSMLMTQFYTHLRDGMGKAEALRQAQIDVRTKYPNPYYWAGFVLSGDGGALPNAAPAPSSANSTLLYPLWVILFCCLCGTGLAASPILGIFLLVRRRK